MVRMEYLLEDGRPGLDPRMPYESMVAHFREPTRSGGSGASWRYVIEMNLQWCDESSVASASDSAESEAPVVQDAVASSAQVQGTFGGRLSSRSKGMLLSAAAAQGMKNAPSALDANPKLTGESKIHCLLSRPVAIDIVPSSDSARSVHSGAASRLNGASVALKLIEPRRKRFEWLLRCFQCRQDTKAGTSHSKNVDREGSPFNADSVAVPHAQLPVPPSAADSIIAQAMAEAGASKEKSAAQPDADLALPVWNEHRTHVIPAGIAMPHSDARSGTSPGPTAEPRSMFTDVSDAGSMASLSDPNKDRTDLRLQRDAQRKATMENKFAKMFGQTSSKPAVPGAAAEKSQVQQRFEVHMAQKKAFIEQAHTAAKARHTVQEASGDGSTDNNGSLVLRSIVMSRITTAVRVVECLYSSYVTKGRAVMPMKDAVDAILASWRIRNGISMDDAEAAIEDLSRLVPGQCSITNLSDERVVAFPTTKPLADVIANVKAAIEKKTVGNGAIIR
jgi:hypothetical protein